MEIDFSESVESTYQMNCLLNKYEKTLYQHFSSRHMAQ